MQSENNYSECNFIEQKGNPVQELVIGVEGQNIFSPIDNYSQNNAVNYNSTESDRLELVLSFQSIQLTEHSTNSEEFKENITRNEIYNKVGNYNNELFEYLEDKISPKNSLNMLRNRGENVFSETSFNSEISAVAVSSYRKSIYNE